MNTGKGSIIIIYILMFLFSKMKPVLQLSEPVGDVVVGTTGTEEYQHQ
jgi:hypothetical protein